MNAFDPAAAASVLRVLAGAPRLAIVRWLVVTGECAVAEIETALAIRQPALSKHLAELRDAGLVATRREARSVYYRLADERVRQVVRSVMHAFGEAPDVIALDPPANVRMDPARLSVANFARMVP